MIVSQTPYGWDVFLHRAHGLLAFAIALQLDERHHIEDYHAEALLAIAEHDEGQTPFTHRHHLNAVGAPLDFTQMPMDLPQAQATVALARLKSQYMQLLISMHTDDLYAGMGADDAELQAFLQEQSERRKQIRRHLKLTVTDAKAHYTLLHWADRASLMLLRGEVPTEGQHIEVDTLPDGTRTFLFARPDRDEPGAMGMTPWPFARKQFTLQAEVHPLRQLAFKDDAELEQALFASPPELRTWTLSAD